jgi:hypothetical protein
MRAATKTTYSLNTIIPIIWVVLLDACSNIEAEASDHRSAAMLSGDIVYQSS